MIKANVHSLLFKKCKIISGTFEGIYAWISVNFLQGNLLPGGSHTQAEFWIWAGLPIKTAFNTPTKDTLALKLGNYVYHLFSRSYLGYGLNEAIKKYVMKFSYRKERKCHWKSLSSWGLRRGDHISGHIVKIEGKPSVPFADLLLKKSFSAKTPVVRSTISLVCRGILWGFPGCFTPP